MEKRIKISNKNKTVVFVLNAPNCGMMPLSNIFFGSWYTPYSDPKVKQLKKTERNIILSMLEYLKGDRFKSALHRALAARKLLEQKTKFYSSILEQLESFLPENIQEKADLEKSLSDDRDKEREEKTKFILPTGIKDLNHDLLIGERVIGYGHGNNQGEGRWLLVKKSGIGSEYGNKYYSASEQEVCSEMPLLSSKDGSEFAATLLEEIKEYGVAFNSPEGERWWTSGNFEKFLKVLATAASWQSKKIKITIEEPEVIIPKVKTEEV